VWCPYNKRMLGEKDNNKKTGQLVVSRSVHNLLPPLIELD
jgi:hypothetical protein